MTKNLSGREASHKIVSLHLPVYGQSKPSILPELAPSLADSTTFLNHSLLSVNRLLRFHRAGPSTSLDELVVKDRTSVYHIGVSMSNLMCYSLVESNHTELT